jgi:hypothetical protein
MYILCDIKQDNHLKRKRRKKEMESKGVVKYMDKCKYINKLITV